MYYIISILIVLVLFINIFDIPYFFLGKILKKELFNKIILAFNIFAIFGVLYLSYTSFINKDVDFYNWIFILLVLIISIITKLLQKKKE
jgi:TRAP-type uncharacterized transport system fused permease subunit